MPEQHAFVKKTCQDSIERYKALLLENLEQIAQDLATTIEEAAAQDKKPSFRITHTLTVDLDKSISNDTVSWSIARRASASGRTPSKDDLEEQEKKDDETWRSGGESEQEEED